MVDLQSCLAHLLQRWNGNSNGVERKLVLIALRPHRLGELGVRVRGGWRDNNEVGRKFVVIHPSHAHFRCIQS